ncbi:MAG: hypothetical protein GPJ51_09240 [Candidatus Heimdallarchaeota archaeon]|nr:hypothetical protein [Candidatus Heimdallarchaeota archaeon]
MPSLQSNLQLAKKFLISEKHRSFSILIKEIEENDRITPFQRLETLILRMLLIDRVDFFGDRDELTAETNKLLEDIAPPMELEIIELMDSSSKIPETLQLKTRNLLKKQSKEVRHKCIILLKAKTKFQYKYNIQFSLFNHYLETILNIIRDFNEEFYYSEFLNDLCWSLMYVGDSDKSIEKSQELHLLAKKLNYKELIMRSLACFRYAYTEKGFFKIAIDYGLQYLEYAKESTSQYRKWHSMIHLSFAYVHSGDMINSSKYEELAILYEKGLSSDSYVGWRQLLRGCKNYYHGNLSEALENYQFVLEAFHDSKQFLTLGDAYGYLGETFYQKGELDQAIEYSKKSLEFRQKYECTIHVAMAYFNLITFYAEQRNFVKAEEYLFELAKLNESNPNKRISIYYQVSQAIFLRYNKENQPKAKEIFEKVIEDQISFFKATEKSYLYLCDILLEQFKDTKDMKLIGELKQNIKNLSYIAESNQNFLLLIELYFLQSKLFILEFNVEDSLNVLEEAQKLANEKGLKRLEILISNEYDVLLEQLDVWDDLSDRLPSLEERFETTHIEEILSKVMTRWVNYTDVIIEKEQPIFFIIFNNEGRIEFSDSFSSRTLEETKFSDLYPKILERRELLETDVSIIRIKFREFMCILSKSQGLFLCYVFVGKSFLAKQKFTRFVDYFSDSDITNTLNDFVLNKKNIDLETRIQLSSLVKQYLI